MTPNSVTLATLRRRLAVVGGSAAALAAVLAGLALAASAEERATRRELFAERVFDRIEQEMSALVSREDRRPFYQYRAAYPVEGAGGQVTLVPSPLAAPPEDAWILGWYQRDPDGAVDVPWAGAPEEVRAAARSGWPDAGRVETSRQALARAEAPEMQLNQAANARLFRQNVTQAALPAQVAAYTPPSRDDLPAGAEVTPLAGHDAGDLFVLERTATIGGEAWAQGLVLRKAAWVHHLEEEAVVTPGVSDLVRLSWRADGEGFAHTFAPPFDGLAVRADVGALPGPSRDAYVLALAALSLAVVATGLVTVDRAARSALELAERRADFAATVTHELKTPLTTIRMYAEMLEGGMVEGTRRVDYLARIRTEAVRLSGLVEAVLSAAKLQKGVPLPQGGPAPLGEVLAAFEEEVREMVAERGFTLTVTTEPGAAVVELPAEAVRHALTNLVDNATRFATGSDRRVEIAARRGTLLEIVVRDHGPGVPPDELPRLFEAFYRPHREMVRQTRGTGLGLAIVKGLVTQAGGEVTAANAADGGFVATIRLPLPA